MRQPPTLRWITETEARRVLVTALSEHQGDISVGSNYRERAAWPSWLRRIALMMLPCARGGSSVSEAC
ncbi:MAG: hypothetical protein JO001_03270 [Alphaproteobacteria bacterium]|nr:hypothetical protein [Alphaproteobacteria bacterium]